MDRNPLATAGPGGNGLLELIHGGRSIGISSGRQRWRNSSKLALRPGRATGVPDKTCSSAPGVEGSDAAVDYGEWFDHRLG